MASSPLLTGFFLDELTLPWGTTLTEPAAHLAARPQWPPYGGWPNLSLACTHALGLAASECNLRAPTHARPVLQASYQLAAPPRLHGAPRRSQPVAGAAHRPARAAHPGLGSGAARGCGHQHGGVRGALAMVRRAAVAVNLRGIRPEVGGPVAAGLFLDWEDELAAAHPYAVAAGHEAARLAAVAGPAVEAVVFQLTQAQAPYTHFDFNQAHPPTDEQRRAQRTLYREHLLATPPYF